MHIRHILRLYLSIILVFIFAPLVLAADGSVQKQFTDRALQASKRIERLENKNGDSEGANLSEQDKCDWRMEQIYAALGDPRAEGIVRESTSNGFEVFKLLFLDAENADFTQVNLVYTSGTNTIAPAGVSVMQVSPTTSVLAIPSAPNVLVITATDCVFMLPVDNPLLMQAQPVPEETH